MKLIIKKSDLLNTPCSEYDNLPSGKFDAIKEIANRGNHVRHVSWLIANCKLAQTAKMLEYLKSLKPLAEDVSWLIRNCKFTQTIEMLKYYKSLKPSAKDVYWLIANCKFTQTADMLVYYKSFSPSVEDIGWLIRNCKFTTRIRRRHYETND